MVKNRINIFFIFVLFFSISACGQKIQVNKLSKYVDPFIGVDEAVLGTGSVFPGATIPFGMVKLGPDCDYFTATAGYQSGKPIFGFSHTHASGTGGGPSYGNILVMATNGKLDILKSFSPSESEFASPGYYSVKIKKYNIMAELTATHRSGFHQYTFPASDSANIIFDAGSFLGHDTTWGEQQIFAGSEVRILSNREIEGYSRIGGGWNLGLPYTVYFYAVFENPSSGFGTWKNNLARAGNREEFDSGDKTGAYFIFKTTEGQKVKLKVGISYISSLKAKENLLKESPNWDFETVKNDAEKLWDKALSSALVEGESEDDKKIFYTALYHSMLMPTEKNGENPKWHSDEPNYDDFYTIWDTHRCSSPLLTLLMEKRQTDIIRSMIDIYKHEGYMPDGRMGNENGRTQGGSDCDIVIADAYVKGLQGIDYQTAYRAMVKNAETAPGGDERKHGRGGLADYNKLGYVSINFERAGNRTLEYSFNDFAIAMVAKGLDKREDYKKYINRASNWQNLWKADAKNSGSTGFIWPRKNDGTWATELFELEGTHTTAKKIKIKFNELTAGSFPNFFYESHSWEYSFFVPHDVKKLIEFCGGKNEFIKRLDTYFDKNYYQVGNEPGFLIPCLYIWAGRQDKTAEIVSSVRKKYYNSSRSGIPGNDDSGAMSSFYAFHAMGIYPNAGHDVYLITSPAFKKTKIQMDNGKIFTIESKNAGKKNIFVQAATLNGKPLNQAWFRHTDIKNGGLLELIMGKKPSAFGNYNPPPSMSDK